MNSQSANRAETYNFSDKALVSTCGLYCGACGIYLATQEYDNENSAICNGFEPILRGYFVRWMWRRKEIAALLQTLNLYHLQAE
jgi:hypothetical protein